MSIYIYPYNWSSLSVKSLRGMLDCPRIRLEGSNFHPSHNKVVINWGNPRNPLNWRREQCHFINKPGAISIASNKLSTCKALQDHVIIPEWTESKEEAKAWAADRGPIYCRTLLNASQGRGIEVATKPEEVVTARLYTLGVMKAREYRAHIFDGECIKLQQKRRKNGEDAPSEIKNYKNGWIFAVNEITQPPEDYIEVCAKAVACVGLDFGAVDFLVKEGTVYVIEINTAPGLVEDTCGEYAAAISKLHDKLAGNRQHEDEVIGQVDPARPLWYPDADGQLVRRGD